MVLSQRRAKRKATGSRYKKDRSKRLYETGRFPILTKIDERKVKAERVRGGSTKLMLLNINTVNLFDQQGKKHSQAKILSVTETPSNRHFVRRNIMTKGSIILTDKGKARITNRPGQEGTLNAVLIA